ncbi:hypothetical protein V1519DRAFT_112841, partial [Lipomyces tetrasporus]
MMDELVSLGNEPILVVALDHDVQNRAFKAVHQDLGGLPLDSDGTGFAHAIRNDPLPIAASTLVNGRFTNRAKQNLPVSKFGRQTSLPDSPTRCSRRRRPCCNRNRLPRQPYDNRNTTCQIWANRVLTSYLIRFKRNRLCWSEGRSDQTRFGAVFGFSTISRPYTQVAEKDVDQASGSKHFEIRQPSNKKPAGHAMRRSANYEIDLEYSYTRLIYRTIKYHCQLTCFGLRQKPLPLVE